MHGHAVFLEAASLGQISVVHKLIDAGTDVNYSRHSSAVSLAAAHGHLELVSMLLVNGADIDQAGYLEPCALLQAIKAGDGAMVQLSSDAGADTRCRSNELQDFTPLQLAAVLGQQHIVGILLAAGAIFDDNDDSPEVEDGERNETALSIAVDFGEYGIAAMLIDAGANVNAKNGASYPKPFGVVVTR